jgi:hypothetical protein
LLSFSPWLATPPSFFLFIKLSHSVCLKLFKIRFSIYHSGSSDQHSYFSYMQ